MALLYSSVQVNSDPPWQPCPTLARSLVNGGKSSSPASCRSASHPGGWQIGSRVPAYYMWTALERIMVGAMMVAKRSNTRQEPGSLYYKVVHWYPGGKGEVGLEPWPWCWILRVGHRNSGFWQVCGENVIISLCLKMLDFWSCLWRSTDFFLPITTEIMWNLEQALTNINSSLLAVWP